MPSDEKLQLNRRTTWREIDDGLISTLIIKLISDFN